MARATEIEGNVCERAGRGQQCTKHKRSRAERAARMPSNRSLRVPRAPLARRRQRARGTGDGAPLAATPRPPSSSLIAVASARRRSLVRLHAARVHCGHAPALSLSLTWLPLVRSLSPHAPPSLSHQHSHSRRHRGNSPGAPQTTARPPPPPVGPLSIQKYARRRRSGRAPRRFVQNPYARRGGRSGTATTSRGVTPVRTVQTLAYGSAGNRV